MANIRKSLVRITKVRDPKLIVIATEGEKTEEKYFVNFVSKDYYYTTRVKLKVLPTVKDGKSAPTNVIKRLDKYRRDFKINKYDELWLVIDKDRWKNIEEIIEECKKKNYNIALSNPCFELWLLLHLKSIIKESNDYKDKLLKNKRISKKRTFIDNEIKKNNLGSYNSANPDTSKFLPNVEIAIDRAKELDTDQSDDLLNRLGTRVYKLAKSILESKN